jgi:integrase
MAKKRADGRFVKMIELPRGPNGERKRKPIYATSQRELDRKVREEQRKQDRGISIETNRQTIAEFLRGWIQTLREIDTKARSTIHKYEEDITNHVIPLVGHRSFVKADHKLFEDMMIAIANKVCTRDVGPKDKNGKRQVEEYYLSQMSLRNIKAAVRGAFNTPYAKKWHPANPIADVEVPKSRSTKVFTKVIITPAMMLRILQVSEEHPHNILYRWMATTGFRLGETLALKKADLDLDNGTVRVARSIRRTEGVLFEGRTKTGKEEVAYVPRALRERVRKHLAEQNDAQRKSKYLFTTKHGTPFEPRNVARYFNTSVLPRAELPRGIRIHDLRDFAGTEVAKIASPRVAQEALRHASIDTTNKYYINVTSEEQIAAMEAMDDLLSQDRILEIPRKKVESK